MDEQGVVGPPVRSDKRASDAVVEAVASRANTRPASLPQLYDAVDPDSLDSLAAADDGSDLLISFEYAGYVVRVSGPTSVTVSSIDD